MTFFRFARVAPSRDCIKTVLPETTGCTSGLITINAQHVPEVKRINQAIERYQKSRSLFDLQRVDALAEQLRLQYRTNPLTACQPFMVWSLQGHVSRELARLIGDPVIDLDNQKLFAEHATASGKLPELIEWKRRTTPKYSLLTLGLFSLRSKYQAIDTFLQAVKFIESNQSDLKRADLAFIESIRNLINKLLTLDIFQKGPLMMQRFNDLLNHANALLNLTIEANEEEKKRHQIEKQSLINPLLHNSDEEFAKIAGHLATSQETLSLNGFKVSYLGGNNNRNWLAVEQKSGLQCVIRVEKADDPPTDYALVDATRSCSDLSRFFAHDATYYPTGEIEIQEGNSRPFNLAVCEFCPDGDLCRYRNSLEGQDLLTIQMEVVDMTEQVARMAATLLREGRIYADIKGENFLRPPVKTADCKSIVPIEQGMVKKELISTTQAYAPPEYLYGPRPEIGIINLKMNPLDMLPAQLDDVLWSKSAYALYDDSAWFINQNRYYIDDHHHIVPLHLTPDALKAFKALVPPEQNAIRQVMDINVQHPGRTQKNIQLITGHSHSAPGLNAEKFMSYQIGLQMYILCTNPQGEAKHILHDALRARKPLDFSHAIFESKSGLRLQQLILGATAVDPSLRFSLADILDRCQRLTMRLDMERVFRPSGEEVIAPPRLC